jgi:hypothetical protein
MKAVVVPRGLQFSVVMALVAVGALLVGCTGGSSRRSSDQAALMILTCRDSRGQQVLDGPPARLVNGLRSLVRSLMATSPRPDCLGLLRATPAWLA